MKMNFAMSSLSLIFLHMNAAGCNQFLFLLLCWEVKIALFLVKSKGIDYLQVEKGELL